MMGSIDAWFYKYIAGIQMDEKYPAFASFIVKPFLPDSLRHGKAQIETMRGRISSEWESDPNLFTLKVDVPFNTMATVFIPCSENGEVKEGGLPVKQAEGIDYIGFNKGCHQLKVHSGKYHFTVQK